MKLLKNNRGQGLIEYLVVVSLMAVATMGIMRLLSHTTSSKLAQITRSLQGREGEIRVEAVQESHYRKKDMSDFFQGSNNPQN